MSQPFRRRMTTKHSQKSSSIGAVGQGGFFKQEMRSEAVNEMSKSRSTNEKPATSAVNLQGKFMSIPLWLSRTDDRPERITFCSPEGMRHGLR
jgi:hypothetical protein